MGIVLEFKTKKKESPSVDTLVNGWEAYDEACQLIDIMPKPIILKLMSYCRQILILEEKK